MENWQLEAELSQGLGSTEWISAALKTKKKEFKFSNSDFNFLSARKTPFPINLEACPYGILITCVGKDDRNLSIAISPILLSQLVIAYGAEAAKVGEEFPFAEAARALTRAQTSIINRKRPAP